ncbi:Trihelix transcription factor GT-3b [Apostasia shenzhenica]|uniref:Trihelix transcription factor GT-3b n=1 Tax=Apostasia shenzhenica TaxID=1088818 RepID=A0A2I0BF28_9ASPA|nr:Trihelix transcription factor GT-3b [Apostasia shenzhenica]
MVKVSDRMMSGGVEGDSLGGRAGMVVALTPKLNPAAAAENLGGGGWAAKVKEEKVPQWGQQETRDLIAIRAELERDVAIDRRNKALWDAAASRMREKGYRRTPDQCECKWKTLVNRYKGKETAEADNGRECPFFEELHALFTEFQEKKQLLLLESETIDSKSKKNPKRVLGERSPDELSDDDDAAGVAHVDSGEEERPTRSKKKKAVHKSRSTGESIHELLQSFLQKQQQIEARWWETMGRRALERRRLQEEWRKSMEKLERERMMLERAWREREDQRRVREECRAGKRDSLLNTLLNKLIRGDL